MVNSESVVVTLSKISHLQEGRKLMLYLTTHSTHFIYSYMASDIWLRTILIERKETHCRHIGYSFRLTARVLLYAPSHRQDSTYHSLCYTSRGALAGTRNRLQKDWSYDPSHLLTTELHLAPRLQESKPHKQYCRLVLATVIWARAME